MSLLDLMLAALDKAPAGKTFLMPQSEYKKLLILNGMTEEQAQIYIDSLLSEDESSSTQA